MAAPLLDVDGLSLEFRTRSGVVKALEDVSFRIARGEILGLVGESGSGKSVAAYAAMGILDAAGHVTKGAIRYDGIAVTNAPERDVAPLRGREMAMIFQSPRTALNPIRTVGDQIADVLRRHGGATRQTARGSRRWRRCASPTPRAAPRPIRSSCRAACASASASPWRWPASRGC